MRRRQRFCRARAQRGVATIEFALILSLLFVLMGFTLLFGRALMQYQTMLSAANAAASYMSMIPAQDITNPTKVAAASATAQGIVNQAVAAAGLNAMPSSVGVGCFSGSLPYPVPCVGNTAKPTQILVSMNVSLWDQLLGGLTFFGAYDPIVISVAATVPYAN